MYVCVREREKKQMLSYKEAECRMIIDSSSCRQERYY